MTIPSRNIEIAIARAIHEEYRRIAPPSEEILPWDKTSITVRVDAANVVNTLILQGVIVPGKSVPEAQA
jgi:hypothetical protein